MKSFLRFATVAVPAAALGLAAWAGPAANPKLEMTVADRGKVTLELYAKEAPKTTAHIVDLCRKKFYDGILIHRVEPGFVVQAGDPKTRTEGIDGPMIGSGGSGRNIPFEVNSRTHETGSLGMALSAPRSATGDSQWFINLGPNHQLDGDYCVFGKVTKGMALVKQIKRGDKIVSIRVLK
jgi:cyclophilin family peptidyl-prolyl cis-trans isomerase